VHRRFHGLLIRAAAQMVHAFTVRQGGVSSALIGELQVFWTARGFREYGFTVDEPGYC
jgi:hypothetical protein